MRTPRAGRWAALAAVPAALVLTPSVASATGTFGPADLTVGSAATTVSTVADGRSELGSRIGIPLLPDTQFYSRYDTPDTGMQLTERYGSNPFQEQAAWIAQHREALNAPLAIHVGDIVDQAGVAQEWDAARRSLQPFVDAGMPFSILAGNHDVPDYRNFDPTQDVGSDAVRDLTDQPYLDLKADPAFAQRDTLRATSDNGFAEFHVVEAEGQTFGQLAISWWASPELLEWAQGVIDAHPELPIILSTHQNIDVAGDGVTPERTEYGEYLWDGLIAENDQIFLVVSGHHHGATWEMRENAAGNPVLNVLTDYQMAYQGGNGYMNLLELDLTDGYIDLATFSPWVVDKPRETLNAFDEPVLTGAHQEWSIPFDFAERFAGFAPDFGAGSADERDLTETAKALVRENWQAPTAQERPAATDAQDFPVVEGTVAHWRPGRAGVPAGYAVPVGTAIPDTIAGADLTRGALDTEGVVGAQEGDVTFSTDHHPLSSDTGSIVFADTDRAANRLSYFATDMDAAVNDMTFDEGYTFEAFVKIDEDWTTDNAWMGAVTRGGDRTDLGDTVGEVEAPPATLALSNLREFQWNVRPQVGDADAGSVWSHEIPTGEWMHVAVVNDPATGDVTMYVEGAPVLRNQVDQIGMAATGEPWILGAGGWEGEVVDGWLGAIGEVRLIDHPTTPDQWLTARADGAQQPGDTPGDGTSAGDIPVTAEIPGAQPGDGTDTPAPADGALALSVAEGGLTLGGARTAGDHVALRGSLPQVTVTDSRAAAAGWTVTGATSDLADGTAVLPAETLGWAPFLVDGDAAPGPEVLPAARGGAGLAAPAVLGSSGGGLGSDTLAADVALAAPVDTAAGTYTGAVTVSLFPQD